MTITSASRARRSSVGRLAGDVIQDVSRVEGEHVFTTRCPITFAGEDFGPSKSAPRLGEDTRRIIEEFHLDQEEGE